MNLVARWPGSAHDATVFNNSTARMRFEAGHFPNCVLLGMLLVLNFVKCTNSHELPGDSGYPIKPYLLTPLLNPETRPQQLYNEAHIRTRNTVERLIGVWKRRFPVLAYGLRLKLDTALTVIVAAGVIHNFAKLHNEPAPPPAEGIDQEYLEVLIQAGQVPGVANANVGNADVRNAFIQNYFQNLQ